jgi:uncharacterized protein YjbI with pentapeptide repeats
LYQILAPNVALGAGLRVKSCSPRPIGTGVRDKAGKIATANFREFIFHALECISTGSSLFIRDSWQFATLQPTRRWVEEVAGLAYDRVIGRLFHELFGRRAVQVVGVVALLVVVVVLLFLVLNWYVAPTRPSERKDLILAAAQILGGTALLSGLYFTWRTLQVNREGQITERFTRAIDQLGKVDDKGKKLFEIRIGGIYALERIARESEGDYGPIMEILTAYLRQNALLKSEKGTAEEGLDEEERTPDPDIQAIISVLRRLTSFYKWEREPVDLHDTDLTGADLEEADLSIANLIRANFTRANLIRADLSTSDLAGANLTGANLTGASLTGADLTEARLTGALLWSAHLDSADLTRADLSRADLSRADLRGANLTGADLSGSLHLTQKRLTETAGDEDTKLPTDLKPPASWDVKTDEQGEGD